MSEDTGDMDDLQVLMEMARDKTAAGRQALVERHGGELVLDSNPGRGTRVTARFPSTRVLRARAQAS